MDFTNILLALFVIYNLSLVNSKLDDDLILTYKDDDHIQKVYSDGSNVVFAFFNLKNELVDCDIRTLNGSVSAHLFKEALNNKEVEAEMKMIDISRLMRQCKRFIRKMLRRKMDDPDPLVRDVKKRIRFHVGHEGTAWCSSDPDSVVNKTIDPKNTKTDNCCKKLHVCKENIPMLTTKLGLFNRFPWPLYSCGCLSKFRNCLQQVKTKLSLDTGTVYFDVLKNKCYDTEKKSSCEKWSEWFNTCLTSNEEPVAKLKTSGRFKD